jgi:A118 family predicted phage portal protein
MFSDIWNKIKELVQKMIPKKSIENVLHITPAVSDRMADAIQLWSDMYEGHSPWLREPTYENPVRIVSLGLPSLIASEKARMVTLEMKSEITAPMQTVDVPPTGMQTEVDSNLGTQSTPDAGTPPTTDPAMPMDAQSSMSITPSSAYQQKTEEVPVGPTERAVFLNKQYQKVLKQIRRQLEYGIAKGGIVIKPYVNMYTTTQESFDNVESHKASQDSAKTQNNAFNSNDNSSSDKVTTENKNASNTQSTATMSYDQNLDIAEIEFDFIQADRFFPLSFDANGKVIEAAFVQTKVNKAKERVYIRLEYHKLDKRTVTVQNLAFESTDMSLANSNNIKSASNLGKSIPLTEVPEWASLQPTTVIEDVDRLLFAYFKMPEANTVDPYSPLGVSGYSRVIQLIKDADMQYSRLLWEFEGGELAIDVDRDALKFVEESDGKTHTVLPEKQNRLFRKVDLNNEETYNVFAPALRDVSITHGLNVILTRIEDACGLSRGTVSEVTTQEAKTATELKILKQRSFATNADIQTALQDALEDMIYVMDVYCTLYEITPPGEYNTSFEWDDSIIIDNESELSKRITLMQNGLASKLETRMWYFGETENQAKLALQQVEEESTQAVLQNIEAEKLKGAAGVSNPGEEAPEDEEEDEEEADDTNGKPVKSPADKTSDKKSKGKQADSLETPTKNKDAKNVKKP